MDAGVFEFPAELYLSISPSPQSRPGRQHTPYCCHSRNHGLCAIVSSCLRFAAEMSLALNGLVSGASNISSICSISSIMRSTSIGAQYNCQVAARVSKTASISARDFLCHASLGSSKFYIHSGEFSGESGFPVAAPGREYRCRAENSPILGQIGSGTSGRSVTRLGSRPSTLCATVVSSQLADAVMVPSAHWSVDCALKNALTCVVLL